MDDADLRAGLKQAGLTQYEVAAYLALLQRGNSSATRIAEEANIPKSRVYDILRNLEEEGFIETYKQDKMRARVTDPTSILQDLQEKARTISQTAAEIKERWQQPDLGDHKLTLVKRFDSVLTNIQDRIEEADSQIQIAARPDQIASLSDFLADATDRGVFVKLSVITNPTTAERVSEFDYEQFATEVRHRTLPAPFVAIIDREHVGFAPQSRPGDPYGVLVSDYTLAYVYHWYFQSALWVAWETIYRRERTDGGHEYVNARECICDIAPLVSEGEDLYAKVRGIDTTTGERVELSGEIVDIIYAGNSSNGRISLTTLAGQATLVLETDEGEYGIGGWGATLEDVEAERVVIRES